MHVMRGVLIIVYGHIENTKYDFVTWLLLPPPPPPPTSSARISNERMPVEL
jgi:hypothetical protein